MAPSRKAIFVLTCAGLVAFSFLTYSFSQGRPVDVWNENQVALISNRDDFRVVDDDTHETVEGSKVGSEGHRALIPRHYYHYEHGAHTGDQEDNTYRVDMENKRTSYVSADAKPSATPDHEVDIGNADLQVQMFCMETGNLSSIRLQSAKSRV
jgi:hypothetical protein